MEKIIRIDTDVLQGENQVLSEITEQTQKYGADFYQLSEELTGTWQGQAGSINLAISSVAADKLNELLSGMVNLCVKGQDIADNYILAEETTQSDAKKLDKGFLD